VYSTQLSGLIYPETAEAQHHALYDPKHYINTKTPKRKRKALFFSTRSLDPVIFDESRAYTLIFTYQYPIYDSTTCTHKHTTITVSALPLLFTSREPLHGTGGFYPSFLAPQFCYFPLVCFLSGLGSGNFTHARLATCNLMLMPC
jgi:hypothetical protein